MFPWSVLGGIPFETSKNKTKYMTLITKGIIFYSNTKRLLYNELKRSKDKQNENHYKKYKNIFKKVVKQAKRLTNDS